MLQPLEGISYANLSLQQTENSGSSRKKASRRSSSSAQANAGEVQYVTMVCAWWGCCGAQTGPAVAPPLRTGFLPTTWEAGCWAKMQPLKDLPAELLRAFGI